MREERLFFRGQMMERSVEKVVLLLDWPETCSWDSLTLPSRWTLVFQFRDFETIILGHFFITSLRLHSK